MKRKIRAFAETVIEPEAREHDEKGSFPVVTFRKMGQQGFLGIPLPLEYGGGGGGAVEYSIFCEEVARASAAYIHNGHYQTERMLLHHGTAEQKRDILPKLASGEFLAATAISEPGVGSSFAGMNSTAERAEGGYLLFGEKIHINDAAEAKWINFFVKAPGGITVFLLDTSREGFRITEKLEPIGLRASPIYCFRVEGYRIPAGLRIGEEGQGVKVFFSAFNYSRIGNASCLLGIGRAALERAAAFARERKVGAQTVASFQGIRWMAAELFT
ncbi:MAG TPA: acyl-CoA dehydrogenase family protein, partial [Thermodesulfobacteriota bacterium]|nr:acyl-CoA dehydrogenase family protein [Thermodesulfobacteriota bacterium]